MKKEFARTPAPFSVLSRLLLVGAFLTLPTNAMGQPPSNSVLAGESLVATRITLSLDEQTLGELLPQLLLRAGGRESLERGELPPIRSLWLDGQVNTGAPVSLTQAGTPAATVILQVAEINDLALFPLPGVLLVGRPDWIDSAVSHLPPHKHSTKDLISVRWPTGSTPAEVLALILAAPAWRQDEPTVTNMTALGSEDFSANRTQSIPTWVPHDIWASGSLIAVDRTLAVGLVLARFDCALRPGTKLQSLFGTPASTNVTQGVSVLTGAPEGVLGWSSMPQADSFVLAYPAGESAVAIRATLATNRSRATIRVANNQLLINTTATQHRHAIAAHWHAAAEQTPRAAAAGNQPAPVFDLRLIDKPAAEVLKQLAQAAGKTFRVAAGAELVGEKLVTLDAKKTTLPDLAQRVAESVGSTVQWGESEVVLGNP